VDISDVEKEIQIQVTADELQPHFDKAYKQEQLKVNIKGFRKGKAPLEMVKSLYGEAIEYDSLTHIASEFYQKAMDEQNISPIGEPSLVDMNYKRGEQFSFKIKYEVEPHFELKEYKNIPVEKLVHHVTDKELDEEILRLRKNNSTFSEVQTVTDDGHVVTVDAQELDDTGAPLIGKKYSGMRVFLDDENVVQEIKTALKNVTAGEKRRAKFEVDHQDHKHTNHLELTVRKIEKVNVPDFNDEFVKIITKEKVTTPTDFKYKLRQDLESYWNDMGERHMIDSLINEIVRRHEITVPESVVKALTDSQIEELKNQYPTKKLPDDFNETEYRSQYRPNAILQAKWYFIRDKIAERENIAVDEKELEQRAEKDAPNMGIEKERLLQYYKNSDSLQSRIVTEKLMKFLRDNAVITEKIADEIQK
jgi:trigger factor